MKLEFADTPLCRQKHVKIITTATATTTSGQHVAIKIPRTENLYRKFWLLWYSTLAHLLQYSHHVQGGLTDGIGVHSPACSPSHPYLRS